MGPLSFKPPEELCLFLGTRTNTYFLLYHSVTHTHLKDKWGGSILGSLCCIWAWEAALNCDPGVLSPGILLSWLLFWVGSTGRSSRTLRAETRTTGGTSVGRCPRTGAEGFCHISPWGDFLYTTRPPGLGEWHDFSILSIVPHRQ